MDASSIPNRPRDVSSASCIASALYEISTYGVLDTVSYGEYVDRIVHSLALPNYQATLDTNGGFILMHSVGNTPHNDEIGVPLSYTDYYLSEALRRRKDLDK